MYRCRVAGETCTCQMERLRRERKADPTFVKHTHQLQVDRLLDVHVKVEIRLKHVVNRLKIEGGWPETLKVSTVEARPGLLLDRLGNDFRDRFEQRCGRVVGNAH